MYTKNAQGQGATNRHDQVEGIPMMEANQGRRRRRRAGQHPRREFDMTPVWVYSL